MAPSYHEPIILGIFCPKQSGSSLYLEVNREP